jgi:divalent metal cation (Fe/Co/Zn/Cd) transporter
VRRHELDLVALVFGAAFVVIGLAYAFARWSWVDGNLGWVLGAFLIALGIAGVVSATSRNRRAVSRR